MEDKTILITGCSTGIGHLSAIRLKERGYRVFAAARKPEDVAKLSALGLESVQLDVDSSASIQAAVQTVLDKTDGKLYALFNNAGVMHSGAIEDLTREVNRAQFETNVFGPMELIRAILPTMRKQGYGRIIQNSSVLGIVTIPLYGTYNASKFALEGFSSTLRQELMGTDIHVSIINPGPITSALRKTAFQLYKNELQGKNSTYAEDYQRIEKGLFEKDQPEKASESPELVVKKLIHALESKHPKAHYFVGTKAILAAWFHRLLPDRMMDWVLTRGN